MCFSGRSVVLTAAVLLALSACTGDRPSTVDTEPVSWTDFRAPASPQPAERSKPPGDRTPQLLDAVVARGTRLVAAGADNAANVTRPLILTSDDAGASWTRRSVDDDSVDRSTIHEEARFAAATAAGFVLLGDGASGPVGWTSPNGDSWTRLTADRKVFRAGDSISAVTTAGRRVIAVGQTTQASGGNSNQIVLWWSDDGGRRWARRAGPAAGLRPAVRGDISVAGVTADRSTVLVAANVRTDAEDDKVQIWRSPDSGRTFRPVTLSDELRQTRSSRINGLLSTGRYYAVAQGAGADTRADGSWDGVILLGEMDGMQWRRIAAPTAIGTHAEEFPAVIRRVGKTWMVAGQRSGPTDDSFVAAGPAFATMREVTHQATMTGAGDQNVNDVAVVGDEAVLVGSTDRSGTQEAAIWRYQDGRVSAVTVPAEAMTGRPSTGVYDVAATPAGEVAVGAVSSAAASWRRAGQDWQVAMLPGARDGVEPSITTVTADSDGALAAGTKEQSIGTRAAVWRMDRAGTWSEVDSPLFGNQGRNSFGGPTVHEVTASRRGWLLVGSRHDGQGHEDAWAAYSADRGASWTDARGGRSFPIDPDSPTQRIATGNLRAPDGDDAAMATALPNGSGFVAAGWLGTRPAVWHSPNGVDWRPAIRPALPRGVSSAYPSHLVRVGSTLVLAGISYRGEGDAEGGWSVWTSRDGGLTWTAGNSPGTTSAALNSLVAVPAGVVAVGSTGPGTDQNAAAWFSKDGRSWRTVPLPADRTKGAGEQSLVGAVVRGGRLGIVAKDVPPTGGGYYAFDLDLPR